MSLSTSPDYLAKHGIKADGGPLDGRYVDDSAMLLRNLKADGGWYRLTGKADGSLVYTFERDLAPLDTRPA